jgi:hypothetical protein
MMMTRSGSVGAIESFNSNDLVKFNSTKVLFAFAVRKRDTTIRCTRSARARLALRAATEGVDAGHRPQCI